MLDAAALLADLAERHKGERDGGLGLVSDVVRARRRLTAEDRTLLETELVRMALSEEADLRGVALEVLVREGSASTLSALERALRAGGLSEDLTDQLSFALARRGHLPARDLIIAHLERSLHHPLGRSSAASQLAYLCRMDEESFFHLAPDYFARLLSAPGGPDRARGLVPLYVRELPGEAGRALTRLVREICDRDARAGQELIKLILNYLHSERAHEKISPKQIELIQERLSQLDCS